MSQVEEVTIGAVAENVLKDIVQVHQLARLVADGDLVVIWCVFCSNL